MAWSLPGYRPRRNILRIGSKVRGLHNRHNQREGDAERDTQRHTHVTQRDTHILHAETHTGSKLRGLRHRHNLKHSA